MLSLLTYKKIKIKAVSNFYGSSFIYIYAFGTRVGSTPDWGVYPLRVLG